MSLHFDKSRAAILVIECQNDLVHESRIGARGIGGALAEAARDRGLLTRMAAVLEAGRAAGVPVLYVNKEAKPGVPTGEAPIFRWSARHPMLAEGSWGAEVHPAVAPQPGDLVLRRFLSVDASYGSGLFGTLRALGRDLIVAMGVSTNFAVEGTVRGAVNRTLSAVVVEDCCASVPPDLHEFSVQRVLPLIATIASAEEVISVLRA